MRGIVNAVAWMTIVYALTLWLVVGNHSRCDPVGALPWLHCGDLR